METDQGDKGDACLLCSSLSTLTDHNMKMKPIALSPSFAFNSPLSCLHTSDPSSLSVLHPPLLIFLSHTLPISLTLCLFLCGFTCQGQKNMDCGGMLKRQNGNSFDLLSLLFLMVLMQSYQSLITAVPATKLLYFTYLHYMITIQIGYKLYIEH